MKYLTLNKLLFLVLTAAVLFSSCFLFPQEEDPIYGEFYNYPVGREDANGKLLIKNSAAFPVLLFISSVSPDNYIGTVGSLTSINVKLSDEKFYTIVAVDKAAYEEKGAQAFQSSEVTYYSTTQRFSITVSAGNAFGTGQWIINNLTDYWVSFKKADGSGKIFAVAAPKAIRIIVPVELNTPYDYIPYFSKEVKSDGKVVALVEIESDKSSRGSFSIKDANTPRVTTISDKDIPSIEESTNTKPAVFVTNSSDRDVRVYIGENQLTNGAPGMDFILAPRESQLFTGLKEGDNVKDINFRSIAWERDVYVTENLPMQNSKVYHIKLDGEIGKGGKIDNYSTTVTEEDSEAYFQ